MYGTLKKKYLQALIQIYLEFIAFLLTELPQFWVDMLHKSVTFMFSV